MRRPLQPVLALVAIALTAALAASLSSGGEDYVALAEGPPPTDGTRAVMFIGNNWDGTADIVDPVSFEKLGRFNTIPDLQERMVEIASDPVDLGYYIAIRALVGEGNDQYADDIFSSHDGRTAFVSRPSLADVVGIDLATNDIVWRFQMTGQRADHMAISPDGTRLLVSDSTANVVHELDTATGKKVGEFASGDSPHENNYSKDGSHIFHASIGLVYTPADQPIADSSKGERYFQVVEAGTNRIVKRIDVGKVMAEHGYEDYSSAVRPMAIAPDERTAYLQLSFLHGFVVWDLENDKPLRVVDLPVMGEGNGPREGYLLDSAHHGLAISPDGSKLCAAGTMSDYAAIVDTDDFETTIIEGISKPYWSTNSADGRYCFVSASGSDEVVVIDYATEKVISRFDVGDHPQRMRIGNIRTDLVGEGATDAEPRRPAGLAVRKVRAGKGKLRLRLRRLETSARGRLKVTYRAKGRRVSFHRRIPAKRAWTVRKRIGRAAPGRVKVTLPASGETVRERVKVRAARRAARLRITRATRRADGTLKVDGRATRGARGKVKVTVAYVGEGSRVRRISTRARIRNGRWSARTVLPSQARDGFVLAARFGGRGAVSGAVVTRRVGP